MELAPFRQPSISSLDEDQVRLSSTQSGLHQRNSSVVRGQLRSSFSRAPTQNSKPEDYEYYPQTSESFNPALSLAQVDELKSKYEQRDGSHDETKTWTYTSGWVGTFFKFLFFGDGGHLVPAAWTILALACVGWSLCVALRRSETYTSMWVIFIFNCFYAIGLVANLHFGRRMNRDHWVERTILENSHTDASRDSLLRRLRQFSGAAYVLSVVCIVFIAIGARGSEGNVVEEAVMRNRGFASAWWVMFVVQSLLAGAFFLTTYMLCALWLWSCFVKFEVNNSLAQTVSVQQVVDTSFMRRYLTTFSALTTHSNMWCFNLRLMVCLCIPMAYTTIKLGTNSLKLGPESNLIASGLEHNQLTSLASYAFIFCGVAFFFMMWLSVAAGGFVNDYVYKLCAKAVVELTFVDNPALTEEENLMDLNAFEGRRMQVLLNMAVVSAIHGIKFSGVILSTQRAITVGSILVTIMSWNMA